MKKYEYVFVVLVYRNTSDLISFFKSLNLSNYKVVVVNSYYDEMTDGEFRKIAQANDADYITVENKGYGAGNNAGCRYALENYEFSHLIISNADVTVENWDKEVIDLQGDRIIAPDVRTLSGKRQNPNIPFKPSGLLERIEYKFFKNRHSKLIYMTYIISRLKKLLFYFRNSIVSGPRRIYSPHGAFLIIPYNVISKLHPLFNEEMFLFNEERHLARLAEENNVEVVYVPQIRIKHMEDGSVSTINTRLFDLMSASYQVYYEYWNK